MEQGLVFNIQKFSIHDGPGVRTTVFLKGCPLRCKWCANPESQSGRVQVLYEVSKCRHCGVCKKSCQQGAISMDDKGNVHVNFYKCVGCLACVKSCPARALTHEGEYKSVAEVVRICLQDIDFYEESDGGVTISGGEGMIQPDFVEALVGELKKHGIHVAIETTGCVSEEIFQRLAPQMDLLLFDVKHHDSEKHKTGTAVGNELIQKNLRWACQQGLNILPRIPVIPMFNADIESAGGLASLLKEIGLSRVQLLPFHQMGEKKYEFLNRMYDMKEIKALHAEDLQEYRQEFLDLGMDCFI